MMRARRFAFAAVLLALTRSAEGQTSVTPSVEYEDFWNTLYAPVTRTVQANGGPA
jgi:hypothetical protein